jgi:hypothetical protein
VGLPAKLNLKLYRGDTRVWTTTFTDGEEPVDLSGHTWLCEIRPDRNRGTVVATIDVDTTEAATGVIRRTLTASEAEKLPGQAEGEEVPVLFWDLQSTSAEGSVQTWLYGTVKVEGDVSDA